MRASVNLFSFSFAKSIVTMLLIFIPILAIYKKWDNRFFSIVSGIFLVNAVGHIFTTVVLGGYSPGFITALIINFPLSIFIIRQLFKHNLLKNFSWLHIFVYGTIGFIIPLSIIWILALKIYCCLDFLTVF